MKRWDIYLIILVLSAAGIWYFFTVHDFENGEAADARAFIYADSAEMAVLPLDKDTSLTVPGYGGNTCTVNITSGTVNVTAATCPDKLCVKQKSIRKNGETIVCLPARILIVIKTSEEAGISDYDAISE